MAELALGLGLRHGNFQLRAIFNRVSKVIRDCIGFESLRSVIGLENSGKPAVTWSGHVFSEFSLAPCDIDLCSDWRCDHTLVFGLRHSMEKRS